MKDNADKFKSSYTSEGGAKFAVSISINFVEGERDKKGNIENFNKGDNELDLKGGTERLSTMGAFNNTNSTGTKVVMNNDETYEGRYYSSAATVLHDVFHVMGLGDRYYDTPTKQGAAPGYLNDIMGYGPREIYNGRSGLQINQVHFDDYGKAFIPSSISKIKIGTTVSKKLVDCATINNPLCSN